MIFFEIYRHLKSGRRLALLHLIALLLSPLTAFAAGCEFANPGWDCSPVQPVPRCVATAKLLGNSHAANTQGICP